MELIRRMRADVRGVDYKAEFYSKLERRNMLCIVILIAMFAGSCFLIGSYGVSCGQLSRNITVVNSTTSDAFSSSCSGFCNPITMYYSALVPMFVWVFMYSAYEELLKVKLLLEHNMVASRQHMPLASRGMVLGLFKCVAFLFVFSWVMTIVMSALCFIPNSLWMVLTVNLVYMGLFTLLFIYICILNRQVKAVNETQVRQMLDQITD